MEVSGSYTLYAPRERVWAALLDPDRLKAAIPGCEELERTGADEYRMRLNVGLAAVKGHYTGTLRITDRREPEGYHLTVDGSGARGVLHGEGTLALEARGPSTTTVTYQGNARLGGAIAGVAGRVAQGAARTLINQFFARVADQLAEGGAPEAPSAGAAGAQAAPVASLAAPLATAAPAITEWSVGIPEARPLEPERAPTEALPLAPGIAEAAREPGPLVAPGPEANAPTPGRPAVPNPAPAFVTAFVRRAGLSDGSIESEQQIAWAIVIGAAVGAFALAVVTGLAWALAGRRT